MLTRADYNFVIKYGEVTPDGVAVYDLNTRKFVYANRYLREMLGMGDRETLEAGESVLRFVHPDDLEYAEQRYRELLSIGCMAPLEFRVIHSDGTLRHVSIEVLWLEESYTFALFVKDVTALRDHEEFVVKVSAQKDTLLDMLLHNLSGPLYMTQDMLALVQKESRDIGDASRMLSFVAENTAHCIGIIQQFLREEHTESVNVNVRRSRIDIVEKTKIVLNLIIGVERTKQVTLNSDLHDNFIVTDSVKFFQVVHNILSNAVKYTEDEGKITVKIGGDDHRVNITVSDDGVGVDPHLRDKLFKQRVDGAPGLKGEPSNGMGLFLCRQLAELIGGELFYEPNKDRGSSFRLSLPRM